MVMGFSANAAKRALTQTGNSLEDAINWIFGNSEDPSIYNSFISGLNDPLVENT